MLTTPPAMCREVLERYTKHNTISRQASSGSPEAGALGPIELREVAGKRHERDAVGHQLKGRVWIVDPFAREERVELADVRFRPFVVVAIEVAALSVLYNVTLLVHNVAGGVDEQAQVVVIGPALGVVYEVALLVHDVAGVVEVQA